MATPYETLTAGLAELLADWHRQMRVLPQGGYRDQLSDRTSEVEDILALAVVAEDQEPELHAAQAETIKFYQGLLIAHLADCPLEDGSPGLRAVMKALRSRGITGTELGLPPAAGAGQVAEQIYKELRKHRLDTMSQDSGQHCECRSDSRYAQHDDDGTWIDINDHRAQMVMKVLHMYGVI